MSTPSDLVKWLNSDVIPKVMKNVGKSNIEYKFKCAPLENFYFLSEIFFAEIILQDEQKTEKEILHVVIKIPPTQIVDLKEKLNINKLFSNEILFYEKFAKYSEKYPRFLFGTTEDIEKTVIVMENVCKKGYKMCPQMYDIQLKYVISAVRELGRFHGSGYVMKHKHPEELKAIVEKLQNSKFIDGDSFNISMNIIGTRPIEWLRRIDYDRVFCNRMETILKNAYENIMVDAIKPVEPLAVLAHGDFTRSNMFFKETSTGLDTMIIDFGMTMYTSPAIDLCTLLFLNATMEDRKYRFNEIFQAYHDSLLQYLKNAEIIDIKKYSIDKMLADYKRRAAYGYMIALSFLPTLQGCFNDIKDDIRLEASRPAEFANKVKVAGGDVLSQMFADVLIELRETGCLDHFLQ